LLRTHRDRRCHRAAAFEAAALASSPVPRALAPAALRADVALYRAMRGQVGHPAAIRGSLALSAFGEHALGWLAAGALGAVVDAPRRRDWGRAAASVALAHGANVAVKRLVRRSRPALEDLPALGRVPSQLSFPSAHAASTFAAATAYAPLAPWAPWRGVALAMAASRIVLGVHYPSDVAAGAALGTVVGRLGRPRGR
jgi:membrane-associated phospholipid phosphatase